MKCNLKKPRSCFQCPYQDCLDGGAKIDNRETEFLKASELTNLSHKQKIIRKKLKETAV